MCCICTISISDSPLFQLSILPLRLQPPLVKFRFSLNIYSYVHMDICESHESIACCSCVYVFRADHLVLGNLSGFPCTGDNIFPFSETSNWYRLFMWGLMRYPPLLLCWQLMLFMQILFRGTSYSDFTSMVHASYIEDIISKQMSQSDSYNLSVPLFWAGGVGVEL